MDVAIDDSAPTRTSEARATRWRESPWVLAAWAAAPWPIWALVLAIGVPGAGAHVPALSHGVLVFAAVLAAMGVWTHRPHGRSLFRWTTTVLGTGLMGELLANALTDMGRSGGFAELPDLGRAIAVWGLSVAVYEIAPIVAATSRVTHRELRSPALSVLAHALFLLLAYLAYANGPIHGELWMVSPWLAVAIALPLAAARSGPERDARLPAAHPRGGALLGVALIAWVFVAIAIFASTDEIRRAAWDMRWGTPAASGVFLVLPAISIVLSLTAAGALVLQAASARRLASGVVTDIGDGGLTLQAGAEEPTSVAIEGALPARGATVTLLDVSERPPGAGPFRDGAKSWSATRAWPGTPRELARALATRAAGWLAWAAASTFGLLAQLW